MKREILIILKKKEWKKKINVALLRGAFVFICM